MWLKKVSLEGVITLEYIDLFQNFNEEYEYEYEYILIVNQI